MLLAIDLPPFEVILFLVAGLIWIINKVVEAGQSVRKRAAEEQRRRETVTQVKFEEEHFEKLPSRMQPKARPEPAPPSIPIPPYRVEIPTSEPVQPEPAAIREAPVPTMRRPARRRVPPAPLPPEAVRLRLGEPTVARAFQPARTTPSQPLAQPDAAEPELARSRFTDFLARAGPEQLREAIVLREIFGPPKALRHRHPH